MTIGDALKKIKSRGEYSETVNICYVIEKHRLLGTVTAMDLLTCDDDELLTDVMDENPITVNTHTDKEEVAQLFNKYDVLTIPVMDKENCMVGIVTVDDAIDVIQEEAEEDFQKMAAIAPTDKPYLKTSAFSLWKVRIPWLILLMLSTTFTGIIISSFEDALSKVVVLTAYIPMLMGTGGNSGSQSSVMVIRGLSLGEIEVRDILKVLWKEIRVSVLCGVSLAVACYAKLIFVDGMLLDTSGLDSTVALVIALTLCATVICAKLIGCVLPIVAKVLKLDPAVVASPFITTIVDAVSLLVYFGVAKSLIPQLM
jgi:magnesium transporter